ncbi:MAG: hypothetical protein K6E47_15325 [Lachnospiraceae bacterium]|nr:hypothetical protein [Lachnospiraceae bacterium]
MKKIRMHGVSLIRKFGIALFLAAIVLASYIHIPYVSIFAEEKLAIDETNFPDPRFRVYITIYIDQDKDGFLSPEEISSVTKIVLPNYNVKTLEGIEFFPNLEVLTCHYNELTSLDLSNNPSLRHLNAMYNQLTEIDISNNSSLEEMYIYSNQLTEIDVSNCPLLTVLNVNTNQLTSIDISNNPALTKFYCSKNNISDLDLSNNPALRTLSCYTDKLSSLDLSNNPELYECWCYDNQLTSLDISSNPELTVLSCHTNRLKSFDTSQNSSLKELYIYDNQLTEIDVSNNSLLTVLNLNTNQLTSIDISNNPALTKFYCSKNNISHLDLSKNPALRTLSCYTDKLSSLNLSNNPELYECWCYDNQLTSLNISNNPALSTLNCKENLLTSLNLSKCTSLKLFYCSRNKFTSLDVRNNTALETLSCFGNALTSLDVSNNTALTYFSCRENRLTSLDISNNTMLTDLYCYQNKLTSLDLSKNIQLEIIECNDNQFKNLDFRNNTKLSQVLCYNNPNLATVIIKNCDKLINEYNVKDTENFKYDSTTKVICNDSDAITISAQPKNVSVHENEIAEFSVTAKGYKLKYLWQYKEKGKNSWTDWSAKTTASISVAYASFRDGMSLRCKISDGYGLTVTSKEVVLAYIPNLAITAQPTNAAVKNGELAYFSVKATGEDLKYLWQYKEKGKSTWIDWTSKTTAEISVAYASYRDGMRFRCVVTDKNSKKVTSNEAVLTYKSLSNPVITTQPKNATVKSGSLANFSIKATGNSLKYLWQYKEKGKSTWTDWTSKTTSEISVAFASYRNGMSLRCVVTDKDGNKVISSEAVLTYESSSDPVITTQPKNATVKSGSLANFSIKATGNSLKYLWQYKEKGKSTWTDWTSKTTSEISVAYASYRNGMSLRCVVTDKNGNKVISSEAVLTYENSSDPVITTQPKNTTVKSGSLAYFSVKATGNGLTYLWQYKEKGKNTWTDWTSKTTAEISVAYASYRNGMSLRCTVTDKNGNKVTSNEVVLTYNN